MKVKTTKKVFELVCSDNVRKMKTTDPVQYGVLYNEWRRLRELKHG